MLRLHLLVHHLLPGGHWPGEAFGRHRVHPAPWGHGLRVVLVRVHALLDGGLVRAENDQDQGEDDVEDSRDDVRGKAPGETELGALTDRNVSEQKNSQVAEDTASSPQAQNEEKGVP